MMKQEPLITAATITAVVTALLALLVAFGIPVTEEQQTAILGVVAVLAPLVVGLVARHAVTANANVVALRAKNNPTPVAGEAAEQRNGVPVTITEKAG